MLRLPRKNVARFDPATCVSCHRNLDPKFLDSHVATYGSECLSCHDGVDTYGRAFDHGRVTSPLVGKHAQLTCDKCHQGARSIADLKNTPQSCYSCHAKDDAHGGQFGQDCAKCHTPNSWRDVTIDHSLTAFPLVGKHTTVECTSCHTNNVFKGTPKDCYSCHAKDDSHNGQFGQNCAQCHTPTGWNNITFDHAKSAFPLTGAHETVACTKCHINGVFKGTPTQCVACHSEPAYHKGLFGTGRASCHNTSGWRPAQFNGAHSFPFNHGGSANTCQTCHPGSLATYTCYTCHDAKEIANKHREEGINDFSNCISCHPTGSGGG